MVVIIACDIWYVIIYVFLEYSKYIISPVTQCILKMFGDICWHPSIFVLDKSAIQYLDVDGVEFVLTPPN